VAWSLLLVIIIGLPFGMAAPRDLLSGGLPLALGGLAVWLVWLNRPRRLAELVGLVPPGDILHPLRRFLSRLLRSSAQRLCGFASASTWQLNRAASDPMNQPGSKDQSLLPTVWNLWRWAGTVWLGVAGLVLMALLLTS
jgi:hypothetical protein